MLVSHGEYVSSCLSQQGNAGPLETDTAKRFIDGFCVEKLFFDFQLDNLFEWHYNFWHNKLLYGMTTRVALKDIFDKEISAIQHTCVRFRYMTAVKVFISYGL